MVRKTLGPPVCVIRYSISRRSTSCPREEIVYIARYVLSNEIRSRGRHHDLESVIDNVPAHHALCMRIQNRPGIEDVRCSSLGKAPARNDSRSCAIAEPIPKRLSATEISLSCVSQISQLNEWQLVGSSPPSLVLTIVQCDEMLGAFYRQQDQGSEPSTSSLSGAS